MSPPTTSTTPPSWSENLVCVFLYPGFFYKCYHCQQAADIPPVRYYLRIVSGLASSRRCLRHRVPAILAGEGTREHRTPVRSVCVSSAKVPLWKRGPVSCQTVRDAAPLKATRSGSLLSIISPAALIKAAAAPPASLKLPRKNSHLPNQESP